MTSTHSNMAFSLSLRLKPDYGGQCPEFLAPVKYRLSRSKLRELDTYEEVSMVDDYEEGVEEKLNLIEKNIKTILGRSEDFDFKYLYKEWAMNAITHGSDQLSGILSGKEDKYRFFYAHTQDLIYLGMQDPGHGFYLRNVLESGRYLEPGMGMRGLGICEISREQLDWIYNITRAHDHAIIGIKKIKHAQ